MMSPTVAVLSAPRFNDEPFTIAMLGLSAIEVPVLSFSFGFAGVPDSL